MTYNVPNIISASRVVLAVLFYYFLVQNEKTSVEIASIIYVFASLSDFFDGWIARKYKEVSDSGKFLDPLADKFLTGAAFIAFAYMDIIPYWMAGVVVLRDFGTTFLRVYGEIKKRPMKTSLTAKWKTFFQMLFIAFVLALLLLKDSSLLTLFPSNFDKRFITEFLRGPTVYYSALALTLFTLWTLFEYVKDNKALFQKRDD